MPYYSQIVRTILITAALIAIIALWAFPLLTVQSLANLETIGTVKYLSWIKDVLNTIDNRLVAIVSGWLPGVILVIFIGITKPLIEYLYDHQGNYSYSQVKWKTTYTYYAFLVLNVFLFSSVGGAVFDILDRLIDNPRYIVDYLAQSLPTQR